MKLLAVLFVLGLALPIDALAAIEEATFDSFYKESSSISWILITALAVLAGGVVFFTGGTTSPIVLGIGSWIGGLSGLSGAAATSSGLALLGGGALTAGGLGMVGGAAFITLALTFSTEVVIDYSMGKAYTEYKYSKLVESSKSMTTLPLPVNNGGSKEYKNAISNLDNIDNNIPLHSGENKEIIDSAIKMFEGKVDEDSSIKDTSMLSLIYFISNDYKAAKKYADQSIKLSQSVDASSTVPYFIYAVSSLYDEEFDFNAINEQYFSRSVFEEPSNKLIPLLFSIYLDRVQLRMNDGYLDASSLGEVQKTIGSSKLEKYQLLNNSILISRYFMQLKYEQQKISSLSSSSNEKIKNSPKTLEVISSALNEYSSLLKGAYSTLDSMQSLKLNKKDSSEVEVFENLLAEYTKDQERLSQLANNLSEYQAKVEEDKLNQRLTYLILFGLLISAIAIFFYIRNKRRSEILKISYKE